MQLHERLQEGTAWPSSSWIPDPQIHKQNRMIVWELEVWNNFLRGNGNQNKGKREWKIMRTSSESFQGPLIYFTQNLLKMEPEWGWRRCDTPFSSKGAVWEDTLTWNKLGVDRDREKGEGWRSTPLHTQPTEKILCVYSGCKISDDSKLLEEWRAFWKKESHASGLVDRKHLAKWKEMLLEDIKKKKIDVKESAQRSGPDLGNGWTFLWTTAGHIFPECPCKQKLVGPQQEGPQKQTKAFFFHNKFQVSLHLTSAHISKCSA